jgi:hypothetical protein
MAQDKIISGKKIVDVNSKTGTQASQPTPGAGNPNQIQIVQGNIPLLTVQLLAAISNKLEDIKKLLEKQNG